MAIPPPTATPAMFAGPRCWEGSLTKAQHNQATHSTAECARQPNTVQHHTCGGGTATRLSAARLSSRRGSTRARDCTPAHRQHTYTYNSSTPHTQAAASTAATRPNRAPTTTPCHAKRASRFEYAQSHPVAALASLAPAHSNKKITKAGCSAGT